MKVTKIEKDKGGNSCAYHVDMEDGRKAYLTVRPNSHPVQVHSGSASGGSITTQKDQAEAIDEASTWLINEISVAKAEVGL